MLIRTPSPSSAVAPTTAMAAAAAAAPWRALFVEHLAQMSMPLGAVSTLHLGGVDDCEREQSGSGAAADATASATATSAVDGAPGSPRVRNCVYRGLWASLPRNGHNPAPCNPAVFESDLPVFTTDARMAKACELTGSASLGARCGCSGNGSGNAIGGGPVEAVWWAAAAGTQWRVRGRAWLLGPDVEGPAAAAARTAIGSRMRRLEGSPTGQSDDTDGTDNADDRKNVDSWSWSREVTAHFGNLSPAMRGSFCNPAPGRPRGPPGEDGRGAARDRLGAPVSDDDLDNAAARANFRVCVIVPEQVDCVDLSRGDDPRRWLYTYVGAGGKAVHKDGEVHGGWEKLEVWP